MTTYLFSMRGHQIRLSISAVNYLELTVNAIVGYVVLRTDIQFVLKTFSIIWPSLTTDEER